jgi:A/G-specific adenine glycosylase
MATARQISGMGGHFPETAEELQKLKGVGPYTAAAIASISFGEAVPVLDGNVMRVLARYYGIEDAIDLPATKKTMYQLLNDLIPSKNPGEFNQAMMEFGALVCTPRPPLCAECPISSSCHALGENKVDLLPVKQSKKAPKSVYLYYFLHRNNAGIAMRKRPSTGIWHNLYEFPGIESEAELSPDEAMMKAGFSDAAAINHVSEEFRHILTHRIFHCRVIEIKSARLPEGITKGLERFRTDAIRDLPVSRLMEKILDHLKEG